MKYQVKIDEEVSSKLFTLDEMLELGLLDEYDEQIMVKGSGESVWRIAREYPFHLSETASTNSTFVYNDDGTVTRKKRNKDVGYVIDEYGQVIRRTGGTRFELSTESLHFTDDSSSRTITITSSGSWSISLGAASWVHLIQSSNTLNVRVDKNYSSGSRTDYFKLKSGNIEKKVDIYQSGASSSNSSSSGSSSSSDDNDGCVWAVVIGIGILILAAIL